MAAVAVATKGDAEAVVGVRQLRWIRGEGESAARLMERRARVKADHNLQTRGNWLARGCDERCRCGVDVGASIQATSPPGMPTFGYGR